MKALWLGLLVVLALQRAVRAAAQEEHCLEAKLDVYYIQDNTGSFGSSVELLRREIQGILDDLSTTFPGSRFGFGLADDSPRAKGSGSWAFCYKKIRALDLRYDDMVDYIKTTFHPVGGDAERSEDSLTSMAVAALDDALGWRDYDRDPADNKPVIRVILLITDALFQYTDPKLPGLSALGGDPCVGHAPTSSRPLTANYVCGVDDYTTIKAASDALKKRKILPLILSRKDTLDGWKFLLKQLDVKGIVSELQSGSSNVAEAVKTGIHDIVCEIATTTTTKPTTTTVRTTKTASAAGSTTPTAAVSSASVTATTSKAKSKVSPVVVTAATGGAGGGGRPGSVEAHAVPGGERRSRVRRGHGGRHGERP